MRSIKITTMIFSALTLSGCIHKGPNPIDPYESLNRKTHKFNLAFDAVILRPPAVVYKTVVPQVVRNSVNNFFNNIYMIPTVANDLLQGEGRYAIKDSWRFIINSSLGVGGLFDLAKRFGLPYHSTDLGLTFAKWGDKESPYLVIPFLGPSTIRDGMGMAFEYVAFTPYAYITSDPALLYSLIGVRYVDLRSQLFETEKLMRESLDNYSFLRDAYLQHRKYLIEGKASDKPVMDEDFSDYVD